MRHATLASVRVCVACVCVDLGPCCCAAACAGGFLDAVGSLLEAGADVLKRTSDGDIALHVCVLCGHWRVAGLLLEECGEQEKQVTALTKRKETALHLASAHGRFECARILLACGSPVCAADDAGNTPLHAACAMGHRHVAMLLLSAGADPARQNGAGHTPASLARRSGLADLFASLLPAGGPQTQTRVRAHT